MFSLYFHIPFCTKKCDYCHFYVLPDKVDLKDQLMEGLYKEWQMRLSQMAGGKVETIYFGGGTPALLGVEAISQILSWIEFNPSTEITLEANPENITYELMLGYRQAGINRLSVGIQSLNDELLDRLGRIHDAKKALNAIDLAHKAGFDNISVDLMYDLPGQTLSHWQNTLQQVKNLPITHLSLYNLTIEPHTVFFKNKLTLEKQLPDENISLEMYETAVAVLEQAGLKQYEISAFAQEGFQSKHNKGYWMARPFLGFGPSAFSYWSGSRFKNISHLGKYVRLLHEGTFPVDFSETLDKDSQRRELLAVRIRLTEGINLDHFQNVYGSLTPQDRRNLEQLKSHSLVSDEGNLLKLTKKGILFYDTVASELI